MRFIRDIIGEKRHTPRKEDEAGQGRIPAEPVAGSATGALRLQPEHRIPEPATLIPEPELVAQDWRATPEPAPMEAEPVKDRLWDEDEDAQAHEPEDMAEEDGFAPSAQALSDILGREQEPQPTDADELARAAEIEDAPEDAWAEQVEQETAAQEDEDSAGDSPLADLSEADLSAWLARMDKAPAQVGDEMAETLAEDAAVEPVESTEEPEAELAQHWAEDLAKDRADADFALSLRAVKDVIGQSAEPAPAPAPEPRAEKAEPAEACAPQAGPVDVPTPALGRGSSRPGRVKTRLLGFNPGQVAGFDPLARSRDEGAQAVGASFPVGWLVVVKGPGRGAAFTLQGGVAQIGRGAGQAVRLDFGDNSISRENHAAVAYDDESQTFYIGHGGKANLVRRNGRPVLSTEEMAPGDMIVIGETTLKFVPLCGPEFSWTDEATGGQAHASLG